ncbi:lipoprotein insertase outer membrane protein LolB [secondary endosymbiont of Heteropsylla cubana]|uniref:lipoprotein insertase outer membrane protein LolB n=1 Tax=secondary endosymbiont of Heteropsylla cubana TaxID=134287 RepID=UPI00135B67AD|nr:lipoprotein insertase outer membrane protein LolB [secondary endosymbiont of Heteropsylla cubana]
MLGACSIHTTCLTRKDQIFSKWYLQKDSPSELSVYQICGEFSYFSGKKKFYSRFHWKQSGYDCYCVTLINPFGITEMILHVQFGLAEFIDNQGKCYSSDNPELLIEKVFGISIPLKNLQKWIWGFSGDATNIRLNSLGYVERMNYSYNGRNWIIQYNSYHKDIIPILPHSIELYQGNNRIKLNIDTWSFK